MQPESGPSQKTHAAAVIGLACSVVICCPVTSLVGALIGWISLRAINASEGRLGGRRIALVAIILGLAMLPIQFLLLSTYNQRSNEAINNGLEQCIETVFDVDAVDRKKALEGAFVRRKGRYPSPEETDAFVASITEQLGAFKMASIVQRSVQPEFSRSLHDVALVFTFEKEMATGGAVCELIVNPNGFQLDVRLVRLEINLPEGGVRELPDSETSKSGEARDSTVDGPEATRDSPAEESKE